MTSGPQADYFASLNLPEPLVHWGHPGNMMVVLLAMGGYGAGYLGWQVRGTLPCFRLCLPQRPMAFGSVAACSLLVTGGRRRRWQARVLQCMTNMAHKRLRPGRKRHHFYLTPHFVYHMQHEYLIYPTTADPDLPRPSSAAESARHAPQAECRHVPLLCPGRCGRHHEPHHAGQAHLRQ